MLPNEMGLLMFLTAVAIFLGRCQSDEKVSFYGESYIYLPTQEAKGATDISFRFRTQLSDAMLLLAAGKTDYCLIKLEAGRLKVHINLGAGESEISSARGLTFNDLNWHEVNITRREANISLQIDVIHVTRSMLPGRFFELNIHYGVFIGGHGDFSELFLGHIEDLRGCMADIVYNGARIIEYARSRKSQSEATAVTWGCSPEFDATRASEISFVEDGAFVAIPRPIARSGSRWEFELRTAAESGLLLYNTGQSSYADYLGIELLEGRIRVLMNKGNGPSELMHGMLVADGKWHRVIVDFNPSMITVGVDGQDKSISLPSGGNRYLDLAETLYIGGIELNKRARALGKGIRSGDLSYKGCLRNMILHERAIGLPDVKVSQGIVVGCVWSFPCLEMTPCIPDAVCSQLGVNSFKCTCKHALCIKPDFADDYKVYSNTNLPVNLEILALSPLSVFEGEHVPVTSQNIAMVLDIAKYGVEEDGVVFNIITPPVHGTLALDLLNTRTDHAFSLRDINQDKIQYMHDGSESTEDSMILEVTLTAGAGYTLPGYLQGRLQFPLHVNVTPVNDPPLLEIPTAKVLRLAQGSRKRLSKELVWALDADTPSESLIYTVLRSDSDAGLVEKLTHPSNPIDSFTQAELSEGLIAYVHRGNGKANAMLGLQVSDGIESSQPAYLRISAYPLQLKLVHNTGLVVVHRSYSLLTPANLSFATNSDDSSIEIRYDVVSLPQFGTLQKLKDGSGGGSSGSWNPVNHFTSRDVEMGAVRYLHSSGRPEHDEFKFQASVRDIRTQQTFDFRITFIDLELKESKRSPIKFSGVKEVMVSSENLKYETNPLITSAGRILFRLERVANYGILTVDKRELLQGESFSQDDVDSGRVSYKLYKRAYSDIEDEFLFRVSAPQCTEISSSLRIQHRIPEGVGGAKSVDNIQNVVLQEVEEGGRVILRKPKLKIRNMEPGIDRLIYNVTVQPAHGWITVVDDSNSRLLRKNATYFTTEELSAEEVYYVHDDSETIEDKLSFLSYSESADFMYVGRFEFVIIPKNDNAPTRSVDVVFEVVSNSSKPLTSRYLKYVDKDLETRPRDLVFTRKEITNGALFRFNEPNQELYEFTQQDLDDEIILFKHHGSDRGHFGFGVSDGHFYTSAQLEIRASPPYVRLLPKNDTGRDSVVQFNGSVILTREDFPLETNVHVLDKDIRFVITEKPKHGVLLNKGKETGSFDSTDLLHGDLTYKHLGGSLTKDSIHFRLSVKNLAEVQSVLPIIVYPESYWDPLEVRHNQTILVEEATSVLVTRKHLEIFHPDIPAGHITFFVKESPEFGYLEIQNPEDHNEEELATLVKTFDQSLINEGRVYYVQSVLNQSQDHFVLDATNGISWLRNLQVSFVIVPDKLYLQAANLTVVEGKSIIMRENDFRVVTSFYEGKVTDFRITEKPKHGQIFDSTKNASVKKFSNKHLNAGVILYRHSSDEAPEDSFKMLAIAGDKVSEPYHVWVNILPVNDELPVLLNKSDLNVWQGGSVILTPDNLSAADNDTQPEDIVFELTSVRNGFFSLGSSSMMITNFTQEDIRNSNVTFTHTNGTDADFSFRLTDGAHETEEHKVRVSSQAVHLSILKNKPLDVFPLTRKPISLDHLLANCSDESRQINFVVRESPRLGKIMMENSEGIWLEVARFTQKDLNESKVVYEHTKQFMDLSANDSFVFDVETHFADTLVRRRFEIGISVSSGGLDRYVTSKTVRVEEGGSAQVFMNISEIGKYLETRAGIEKPAILVRLNGQPKYGHVMLQPDLNVTTFTQEQMESGKITYYHDHSDTLEDKILFSVYLTPGHILLCNISVLVIVSPVNDEPFKLITNAPYITVVQNQNQTITRENLLTTDPDTDASELVYDVISGPTYGRLLLLSSGGNSTEVKQVNKFVQQDVDSNRLIYEHLGPLQAASFYFRVSDGRFNPVYTVFNVHVLPIRLNVTVVRPVHLQQGTNIALISEENINLDTNARQELVLYEVSRMPQYGVLYVRDVEAASFRQSDLLSKSVVFMQTNMSVANDSLELSAQVSGFHLRNIHVEIKVVPLMIMKPMIILTGERNKLTLQYLDATPLAQLSSSNPTYQITRKPKFGKIKRIIRSSGERKGSREREVSRFSHQEVASGVIYLVSRKLPTIEVEGIADSFSFLLVGSAFQPAAGEFTYRIKLDLDDFNNTLAGPMDPVGHEGEMAIAPNMSNDYLLILGMLLGVFLLGVVVIVTIRYRHNRYKHAEEDKPDVAATPALGVMPLPRPPDHLMPTTPHLKRYPSEHQHHNSLTASTPLPVLPTVQLPSTLPQCKVIPLSPLESITGSEVDVSARYPYGVADPDEWSSFDTSDLPTPSATGTQRPANPLLRRNQYWV
ncbi:chondroitin sulfate proteoglycan 4 [Cephus cinctus]|uniref:Chondroitin sulfate proteoglycan 4 n=1 Tax=Cephus cinctus TaxID=211228 RepID=A0AAJ7C8G8_CEPCN|nr:chondroitin sulfate proteoglycan 4 [Cephus cinctus]XP_024945212.1 chondroitin sulfate proteoglycan 4 [Cephus cinctus]